MYNLHLKYYRDVESAVKIMADLSLPFHVIDELLNKCSYVGTSLGQVTSVNSQGELMSWRRQVVKIIAESLSQHDEKHVVSTHSVG
jgi:hypothetical protein